MNVRCFATSIVVLLTFVCPVVADSVLSYRARDDAWFASDEGKTVIDNIISHQRSSGGWKKAYDAGKPDPDSEKKPKGAGDATIDNGATHTELRLLARAYTATKRPEVLEAFNKGLDFLLTMQYPNGGWPQRWPVGKDYGRYVTFNDDAMANVMTLLQDISEQKPAFAFVDAPRREKAKAAFDRGMALILKTQIRNPKGELTAWAQQYDEKTLEPAKARSYELPAISGSESAGIMMLLMRQQNPTAEMKAAINAGAAWFEASKITGKRLEKAPDYLPVDDASAGPLWARYYEIDTNRPFYCDRDGIKKYSLAEVGLERRKGYAWLRPWGDKVLAEYPKWKAKNG